MKKSTKDALIEILKSKSRFFSILIITLVGIVAYVGMKASTKDINIFLDNLIKKNEMYDILIEAPYGFSNKDVENLNKLDNIKKIEFYREDIIDKKLYIYKDNNIEDRFINYGGKYFDLEYLQKDIFKNGIQIKDAYIMPREKSVSINNKAKIYFNYDISKLSDNYRENINKVKYEIEDLLKNNTRKDEIIKEIDDGISKIDKNRIDLVNKKAELIKANNILVDKKEEFLNANLVIDENENKLFDALNEINNKKSELNENYRKIIDGLDKIYEKEDKINNGIKLLEENEKKVNNLKPSLFLSQEKINEYKKEINDKKNEINEVLKNKELLLENKKKIEDGFVEINKNLEFVENNLDKLHQEKENYINNYDKNINLFSKNEKDINNGLYKINSGLKRLDNEVIKLNELKEDIGIPFYIVNNIYDNYSFSMILNAVDSIEILNYLYPTFFFIISLFVVTTTMIRFSDEQKTNTGVYRFLGYKNSTIFFKYFIYGMIPVSIGIILGSLLGFYFIPKFIITNVLTVFVIKSSNIKLQFLPQYAIFSSIIMIIFILFAILYTFNMQMKEKIINLLTGNSVILGKRILIEKLFFWKNLKFSHKIYIRNLFKYKGRMFMTIIGISCCSALIYLGFSLRDSIVNIPEYQYNNYRNLDATVIFKENVTDNEINEYIESIKDKNYIYEINYNQLNLRNNKYDELVNYIIFKNNEKDIIFENINDDKVIITTKSKILFNLDINDKFYGLDRYKNKINMTVGKIKDSHIGNYIYAKDKNVKTNALIIKYKDGYNDLKSDIIYTINYENDFIKLFDEQVKSLNDTIGLILSLGAILAIVVTYNLGNINILERKKEIATLKVLGYRPSETRLYIFREIITLSIIAIFIGLILGRYLLLFMSNLFITSQIQLLVKFNILPFVYTTLLSLLFIIIVLIILSKKIEKIEMVKALKINE